VVGAIDRNRERIQGPKERERCRPPRIEESTEGRRRSVAIEIAQRCTSRHILLASVVLGFVTATGPSCVFRDPHDETRPRKVNERAKASLSPRNAPGRERGGSQRRFLLSFLTGLSDEQRRASLLV
jgi:hypothetical protein